MWSLAPLPFLIHGAAMIVDEAGSIVGAGCPLGALGPSPGYAHRARLLCPDPGPASFARRPHRPIFAPRPFHASSSSRTNGSMRGVAPAGKCGCTASSSSCTPSCSASPAPGASPRRVRIPFLGRGPARWSPRLFRRIPVRANPVDGRFPGLSTPILERTMETRLATARADLASVNNAFYDTLGDRWYDAYDDPVALLRAEGKLKNPWVMERIRASLRGPATPATARPHPGHRLRRRLPGQRPGRRKATRSRASTCPAAA